MAAKQYKAASDQTAELSKELANELGSLRTLFHDICERFQTNTEAMLLTCVNLLPAEGTEELSNAVLSKKDLIQILAEIKLLKVKPDKGRLKDLRRIEKLVQNYYKKFCEM